MAEWTVDTVAARFAEAARTAHCLPPVRVQGHFNLWPPFVRTEYERMAAEDPPPYRFPPSPTAIERMLVTMHWVQWLEVEQRHLVWMRAERYGWRDITIRFACNRTTAWRRWKDAMQLIANRLNRPRVAAE